MRGKAGDSGKSWTCVGITPAYAGKSLFWRDIYDVFQDHPRVCGEKYDKIVAAESVAGSPPRMRGKAHALEK